VTDGLLEQGADVLVALERYVERSEQRRDYREGHGRTLSKAHRQQLEDLRQRIDMIIDPPADVSALKAEFDSLCEQLEDWND
jgi:hypothetical protein